MFSILANIIIVFGLFGMLVATWMLVKGAKKAVQFAGVSCDNRKNRKIRPKKPNYFIRWWNHLKSLYEEDMRKQRMLKRSLPEVQITEVTEPVQQSTTEVEETSELTVEVTPVSETTESATEEVAAEAIFEVLEPEVLEPETKPSKKRGKK